MNIKYDDETQTALDELDRNIKARTKYLTTNSFGCKAMTVLLVDPVLQELQKIKANLLATATIKTIEYDDQELAFIGSGEPFLDETDMYSVNLKKKLLIISTPSHKNSEFEQVFNSHFTEHAEKAMADFGKAVYNAGEAARIKQEQLWAEMKKMRPVKAPVFDEMNKFHDESLPEPLAVPRTQWYGKRLSDIEQFNIEESE